MCAHTITYTPYPILYHITSPYHIYCFQSHEAWLHPQPENWSACQSIAVNLRGDNRHTQVRGSMSVEFNDFDIDNCVNNDMRTGSFLLKALRSVDFGSIQIKNHLLNDDAEEVIGTRSSQVIYCILTMFPSDHKMAIPELCKS